ncbi:MAG: sensor histidine kinase, partial [Anaerolineae bacterium]|nr:sensor histidine kinase [Anaerolineae bacterium]
AGARICRVRLTTTPGEVRLLVADDGAGFDTNEVSDGRLGLVGLNERARLLHGQLRLETSPGAGTAVEVVVPLLS